MMMHPSSEIVTKKILGSKKEKLIKFAGTNGTKKFFKKHSKNKK